MTCRQSASTSLEWISYLENVRGWKDVQCHYPLPWDSKSLVFSACFFERDARTRASSIEDTDRKVEIAGGDNAREEPHQSCRGPYLPHYRHVALSYTLQGCSTLSARSRHRITPYTTYRDRLIAVRLSFSTKAIIWTKMLLLKIFLAVLFALVSPTVVASAVVPPLRLISVPSRAHGVFLPATTNITSIAEARKLGARYAPNQSLLQCPQIQRLNSPQATPQAILPRIPISITSSALPSPCGAPNSPTNPSKKQ